VRRWHRAAALAGDETDGTGMVAIGILAVSPRGERGSVQPTMGNFFPLAGGPAQRGVWLTGGRNDTWAHTTDAQREASRPGKLHGSGRVFGVQPSKE
jgi:hypothetical protein